MSRGESEAIVLDTKLGVTIAPISPSLFFAGFASHIGRVPLWWISAVESRCVPDVVTYLELPLDIAAERLRKREGAELGHEEDMESQIRFRDDYEIVFANPPGRLKRTSIESVDASQNELVVAQSIANVAFRHLGIEPN